MSEDLKKDVLAFLKNKMLEHMRNHKQIYSLNEFYMIAYSKDFSDSRDINISQIDNFLHDFGIFLTAHEESLLFEFIKKKEFTISVKKFEKIFDLDIPEELAYACEEIFESIKDKDEELSKDEFLNKINIDKHPYVTYFGRKTDFAKSKIELAINFVSVSDNITLSSFIDFHKDIYAFLPDDEREKFIKEIHDLWR